MTSAPTTRGRSGSARRGFPNVIAPRPARSRTDTLRTALTRLTGAWLLAVVWAAAAVAPAYGAAGPVRASTASAPRWPRVEVVQTTADRSLMLTRLRDLSFTAAPAPAARVIEVDDTVRDQPVIGVGGALTDSSAWLIAHALSPASRTALMNQLFGARGDRLSFAVVPIGASDFTHTGRPYSYDDVPAGQSDPALSRFSIGHDLPYIIPVLRQALALNPQLQLFAVPWSPPSWMKANDAPDDLAGRGTLLPSAYAPLAAYFVKFLQAYAAHGIPIAAIAPENEPQAAAAYPSLNLSENDEARWIDGYLAPALRAAYLSTPIYGADIQWSNNWFVTALAADPAASALSGIAWHCYAGIPTVMSALHTQWPALGQLVTECAPELHRFPVPEILIGSLRNWASSVTLWNLALNPAGGPVQQPNRGCPRCTGLVTIDERTHRVRLSTAYYQLGQLSRFVQPGARRVASNSFVSYYTGMAGKYGVTAGVDDVAFVNPDDSRVVVAYNNSATRTRFAVSWQGHRFTYSLTPRATATFVWTSPTVTPR